MKQNCVFLFSFRYACKVEIWLFWDTRQVAVKSFRFTNMVGKVKLSKNHHFFHHFIKIASLCHFSRLIKFRKPCENLGDIDLQWGCSVMGVWGIHVRLF